MKLSDFDFDLPEDRIALRPADPRDSARLLVVKDGALDDRVIRDLPDFLRAGDATSRPRGRWRLQVRGDKKRRPHEAGAKS